MTLIITVTLSSLGLMAAGYLVVTKVYQHNKLKKLAPLFPNCPFPLGWNFKVNEPVFVLPQYLVSFELKRGTRSNGFFGVIGVHYSHSPKFADGTNMVKLQKDVEKLSSYLRSLGYEVKDDYGLAKELKDAVSHVNTLDYIDITESQEPQ